MTNPVSTGYAPVNGLYLYYEVHGAGEPLIMLHGGVMGIEMFGSNLPELARQRKVIAVELQGHGRTADINRRLSFEAMADDVAALMTHLGIVQADVMGYSLGGGVALQTAIRHPESVRKLVVVSHVFKRDGWYPEIRAAFDQMGPSVAESMKESPPSQLHPNVNWAELFTKLGNLLRKDYDWSKDVAAIKAPTMIVFADADAVRTEHIVEFFAALGGGQKDAGLDGSGRPAAQLAILPGLTHYNIGSSPALAGVVTPFLEAPMPGGLGRSYIERNRRERERLRTLVSRLGDDELRRPVNEHWTVAGVLGHVAFWDARILALVDKLERGVPFSQSDAEPEDVDWINDATRPLIHAIAPREVAQLALRLAEETDRRVGALPPERMWPLDAGSPLNPLRAAHRGEHLDEIDAALGAKPVPPPGE